jgi:hypothetical protein
MAARVGEWASQAAAHFAEIQAFRQFDLPSLYRPASARGLKFVLYYSNSRTVPKPLEDLRSISLYLLKMHWSENDEWKHFSGLYELCITFNFTFLRTVKRLRLLPLVACSSSWKLANDGLKSPF